MLIPEPKNFRHSDENLLPMINIVFLLLIFFMIAGAISALDALEIRPADTSAGSDNALQQRLLLLAEDGRMMLAGQPVTLEQIAARLAEFDAELDAEPVNSSAATAAVSPQPLQVKADAAVSAERLFELMTVLNQAGIKQIELLALASDEQAQAAANGSSNGLSNSLGNEQP